LEVNSSIARPCKSRFLLDAGNPYDKTISAHQKIVVANSANVTWFESLGISAK
jgi:hypothetical protein